VSALASVDVLVITLLSALAVALGICFFTWRAPAHYEPPAAAKASRRKAGKAGRAEPAASVSVAARVEGEEVASSAPGVAMEPSSEQEAWEVLPPRGEGPPTESEKALLRTVKKLREIKAIELRLQLGEDIEPNQRTKLSRKDALLDEWFCLLEEVTGDGPEKGSVASAAFVTVRPGAKQSELRSEAARLAGATPVAATVRSQPVKAPGPPQPGQTRSAKKKKKKDAEPEDEGWVTVVKGKTKAKDLTWEEKEERRAAQRARESLRVKDDESEPYRLTMDSIRSLTLFSPSQCELVEGLIDQVVVDARRGLFKPRTVDLTPMRNKYFFGFAYTYGAQRDYPGASGIEAVWPPEETSEIPAWIREHLIAPLEAKRVVPKGWINSATINDYAAGGCIVSHIDPPHLFDRPIISVSFFSDCNLVFGTSFAGTKEASQELETTIPVYVHSCVRGHATVLKGYSADKITHAIRPCDLPSRRASVILRRVLPTAPVLVGGRTVPVAQHLINQASGE